MEDYSEVISYIFSGEWDIGTLATQFRNTSIGNAVDKKLREGNHHVQLLERYLADYIHLTHPCKDEAEHDVCS